jgi:hypothetical protein
LDEACCRVSNACDAGDSILSGTTCPNNMTCYDRAAPNCPGIIHCGHEVDGQGGSGGEAGGGSAGAGGSTDTCTSEADCGDDETCGDDGLCWPNQVACTWISRMSGFVNCEEGYTHRDTVEVCVSLLPRENYTCGGGGSACSTDDDCSSLTNGHCSSNPTSMGACSCFEGCTSDADCGNSGVCQCRSDVGVGRCASANCHTDADCDPGFLCASYTGGMCGVISGYACQRPEDECATDADCNNDFQACQLGSDGHRVCGGCGIP